MIFFGDTKGGCSGNLDMGQKMEAFGLRFFFFFNVFVYFHMVSSFIDLP